MITSFRATGFRKFSTIHFDHLGNYNLIVGNMNAGKTSFLEAVHTFFYGEHAPSIVHHLGRGGAPISRCASYFFHNLDFKQGISLEASFHDSSPQTVSHFGCLKDENFMWTSGEEKFVFEYELTTQQLFSCTTSIYTPKEDYDEILNVELFYLLEQLGYKRLLASILGALDPIITDILVENGKVQLVNAGFSISLKNSGHGLQRLFKIVCGFVANRGGVYCIDDIERGFHPLVLRQLPNWLHELAENFQIQLFMTTNSREFVQFSVEKYPNLERLCILDVEKKRSTDGLLAESRLHSGYDLY